MAPRIPRRRRITEESRRGRRKGGHPAVKPPRNGKFGMHCSTKSRGHGRNAETESAALDDWMIGPNSEGLAPSTNKQAKAAAKRIDRNHECRRPCPFHHELRRPGPVVTSRHEAAHLPVRHVHEAASR